jgi:hypothetical protein
MERAIGAAPRAIDTTAWSRDTGVRYHCLIQLRDMLADYHRAEGKQRGMSMARSKGECVMGDSTPVNVVRSAVRALNDGDVEGYVRCFDPSVTASLPVPGGGCGAVT